MAHRTFQYSYTASNFPNGQITGQTQISGNIYLRMRFFINFTILATFAGIGNTASIPATPRFANRPQIATIEDIPKLPEGFTWNIVEWPKGNDTRNKTSELPFDPLPRGLEKRAITISCTGVSIKPLIQVPTLEAELILTRNAAWWTSPFMG